MEKKQEVTTTDIQGNLKKVEIHGSKADKPKGVKIVGARTACEKVNIVEKKNG